MPTILLTRTVETPLGIVVIRGTESGVREVLFSDDKKLKVEQSDAKALLECADQLEQYFAGVRTAFDRLPLQSVGTDFQQRVWDAVANVGWGETVTYGDLAKDIGDGNAARAVGTALGRNPICIIVPCHRVVASDGTGGGYAGGQWRKDWLLDHEKEDTGK